MHCPMSLSQIMRHLMAKHHKPMDLRPLPPLSFPPSMPHLLPRSQIKKQTSVAIKSLSGTGLLEKQMKTISRYPECSCTRTKDGGELRCRIRVDNEKSGFVGDHGGRKKEREGGLVLCGCVGGKCENEVFSRVKVAVCANWCFLNFFGG